MRYGKFNCQGQNHDQVIFSNWFPNFNLPQFSQKAQGYIEISKGIRTEIISAIAWKVWRHTQYPSPEEYNAVFKLIVQKHPILKDTIGNGYVSNLYIVLCYKADVLIGLMQSTAKAKNEKHEKPVSTGKSELSLKIQCRMMMIAHVMK